MSRDIDTSDLSVLSWEDLEYLRVRGRLTAEQEAEFLGAEAEAPTAAPMETYTGDENTLPSVQTNDGSPTLGPDEYEDSSNERLREELRRRGLSTSGNKADLILRLEEDDGN